MIYTLFHILYNFLWIAFALISNAQEIVNIEDFYTFEKKLKNCETYGNVKFIINNNITITHQIEINYKDDVNIHITSLNKNVYINQNFLHHSVTNSLLQDNNRNLMISLSNIKEIKIDNININGNIGIYETDVFSIKSVNIIGDITLSKIKDEFLINNSHFKQNNEITHNGYIITIKESSEGTISDTIFDTDVSTKQVISIHDCNNLIIKDSKFNGSLDKIDKMENAHNFHRVFLIYNSNNIELNNLHIQNFGGNTFEGYI